MEKILPRFIVVIVIFWTSNIGTMFISPGVYIGNCLVILLMDVIIIVFIYQHVTDWPNIVSFFSFLQQPWHSKVLGEMSNNLNGFGLMGGEHGSF